MIIIIYCNDSSSLTSIKASYLFRLLLQFLTLFCLQLRPSPFIFLVDGMLYIKLEKYFTYIYLYTYCLFIMKLSLFSLNIISDVA